MGVIRRMSVVAFIAGAALTASTAASAVVGGAVTGRDFVARIDIAAGTGQHRACTGALVAPQWIVTARACAPGTAMNRRVSMQTGPPQ